MSNFQLDSLLAPELATLAAYVSDERHYDIRLDANEAPPLLPDSVRTSLAQAAGETAWERYPDSTAQALRGAIAAHVGVAKDEIVVGAGSDELITLLVTALSRPRGAGPASVLTLSPTFVMYRQNARARGQQIVEVPVADDWDLSTEALNRAIREERPNLIFIASPNNPTGVLAHPDRMRALLECAKDSLVVIDEAYIDYASHDQLHLYRQYPNVAILRTLSKVGFAALRVGFLIARPELACAVDKIRSPYNLPTVSQRLATLVLTEFASDIRATVRAVVAERGRLASALANLGVGHAPSEANFLWLRTPRPAELVQVELVKRGILVRSFHRQGGRLLHQLRVTVGTPSQNDRFLAALQEILST